MIDNIELKLGDDDLINPKSICKICNNQYCDIKRLVIHIRTHGISSKCYYDKYFKKDGDGVCRTCGKVVKYSGMKYGYLKHCNASCAQLDPEVRQNYKSTCVSKYGVDNVFQLEEVKQKIKNTSIIKYGASHHLKLQSQKDKVKNTCLKKYGVESVNQVEYIREKTKQSCLKKYGVEYSTQSEQMQIKSRETMINRYGVEHALQLQSFQDKYKQTCLNHFGVDHPHKSLDIRDKFKHTCFIKYGVEYPSQIDEVKLKIKQTSLDRFGVDHPSKSEKIKNLKKRLCITRYDVEHPMQLEKVKEKLKQTCLERFGETTNLKCNETKDKIIQTCLEKYGVEHWAQTDEGRKSSRITAIKYAEKQILNGEPPMPRVGDLERPFLNELQKYIEYEILRQDPRFRYVIGRFPDGHIPELRLCILFDEPIHFEDIECTLLNEASIYETRNYESMEGYTLFRVSQKEWEENPNQIINRFQQLIKELKCQDKK